MTKENDRRNRAEQMASIIRQNLKRAIARQGVSQQEVARKAGMNPASFSQMLNGNKRLLFEDMYAVCDVLGLNIADLMDATSLQNEMQQKVEALLKQANQLTDQANNLKQQAVTLQHTDALGNQAKGALVGAGSPRFLVSPFNPDDPIEGGISGAVKGALAGFVPFGVPSGSGSPSRLSKHDGIGVSGRSQAHETLGAMTTVIMRTSKGDPDRPCVACDTRFEITDARLATLKADGYEIVGRYLTEPGQSSLAPKDYFKAIRPGELERITRGGMRFFPIFQEYSTKLEHFTPANGAAHAKTAREAAQRLGIPPTHIYFAVDFDATDDQVTSNILPYFRAVCSSLGGGYGVGIYASRNICSRVIGAGCASNAFVSDMSTGFSGNLGFPIPDGWVYDQFTEIDDYKGQGWDLDRVAYSGKVSACASLLPAVPVPAPDPDPVSPETDPLLRWVAVTEQECRKALAALGTQVAVYEDSIGQFILEWLRKPEYWSEGGSGTQAMWHAYTPEVSTPPDLDAARVVCANVCEAQPSIKEKLPSTRDVAHMAATALGYLTWGIENNPAKYGLGDLGGWPLDLLQIWGAYRRDGKHADLAAWLYKHLGKDEGFGYDDVLADADAWLIASSMRKRSGSTVLSAAMRETFKQSETHRIVRFYDERFASSADNVVSAYSTMADGLDALGLTNIGMSESILKKAAGTDKLPDKQEAEVSARAFAAFIDQPRR